MTNSNPEIPSEVPPVAAVQPNDNRRRLRELLSVAERDRTDEQWDEIIELEIQLAPGNRIAGNEQGGGADRPQSFHNKPSGGGQPKKHRPRSNNPGGGGGGGGGAVAVAVAGIGDRARTSLPQVGIQPDLLVSFR